MDLVTCLMNSIWWKWEGITFRTVSQKALWPSPALSWIAHPGESPEPHQNVCQAVLQRGQGSEKLRPPAHSHVSDGNPLGPDKHSDACNPGQQRDGNLLWDPEPELPG